MYDVIVAGGSYAGMAAALQLARARRKVVVIDGGQRRNRFAASTHGFLTRDGEAPGEIAARAKEQLLDYATVTWIEGKATKASGRIDGFSVETDGGETHEARRLVLATGIVDILPDVPGLSERWGKSVFHCPYSHGYELNQGRLGVLAVGPISMHQAMMLPDWGTTTLFTNGAFTPDDHENAQLAARGVSIETARVISAGCEQGISLRLEDGREAPLEGLFVAPRAEHASELAHQLGCRVEEGPLGSWIGTDEMKATSVDGVFAAGDAARMAGSVTFAVADGAMAGFATHRSLMFRDRWWARRLRSRASKLRFWRQERLVCVSLTPESIQGCRYECRSHPRRRRFPPPVVHRRGNPPHGRGGHHRRGREFRADRGGARRPIAKTQPARNRQVRSQPSVRLPHSG